MSVTIKNYGTVVITKEDENAKVELAKDELLNRLYLARESKTTIGGYSGWKELIDMYFSCQYDDMINFLQGCQGRGGITRKHCINLLNIIKNNA